jgi:hypothetical protein
MNEKPNGDTPPSADHLVLTCLAHFEQEEAMLAASLQALRELRRQLLRGDLDGLQQALAQQQQAAGSAADLVRRRQLLRQRLAAQLGLPLERTTLRTLAEQATGTLRARLLQARQRLLDMAGEIERLSRGNQALVQQSLDLLQKLLGSLSSQTPGSPRYTATGQIEPGSCGHFFQARC